MFEFFCAQKKKREQNPNRLFKCKVRKISSKQVASAYYVCIERMIPYLSLKMKLM